MNGSTHSGVSTIQRNELSMRWVNNAVDRPCSHSYLQVALVFTGCIEIDIIRRAVRATVMRHASLSADIDLNPTLTAEQVAERLRYFLNTGYCKPGLWHLARANDDVVVELVDISNAEDKQREMCQHYESVIENWPVLNSAPHLRAILYRRGSDDHLLVVAVDHLVCDRWSILIIQEDIVKWYRHLCGQTRAIATESLPFSTFARLNEERIVSGAFAQSVDFWRDEWSIYGEARIAPSELSRQKGVQESHEVYGKEVLWAGSRTLERIKVLASRNKVTPFMVLLGAVLETFRRETGRDRIALWINFANRYSLNSHHTVGPFAHAHLVGFDLRRMSSFRDTLALVRSRLAAVSEHQALPLPVLWDTLQCRPLQTDAQVLVDLAIGSSTARKWESDLGSRVQISGGVPPPSLSRRFATIGFYGAIEENGVQLMCQYRADLYPREVIRSLLARVAQLLCVTSFGRDGETYKPDQLGAATEPPYRLSRFVVGGEAIRLLGPFR